MSTNLGDGFLLTNYHVAKRFKDFEKGFITTYSRSVFLDQHKLDILAVNDREDVVVLRDRAYIETEKKLVSLSGKPLIKLAHDLSSERGRSCWFRRKSFYDEGLFFSTKRRSRFL